MIGKAERGKDGIEAIKNHRAVFDCHWWRGLSGVQGDTKRESDCVC
jgi:tartrate dehydratase beta subunit/fumarate hydratase class I family protein